MECLFVWWVWLVVAILTLIVEMLIPSFVLACFSVGAVLAAVASALGAGVNVQLAVFAVVTLVVFFFIRPFALKYLHKKDKTVSTNQDALPGRVGRVVTDIDPITMRGEVRIDGDIFPARAADAKAIPAGTEVKVVKVDSIVMIVTPV